MSFVLVRFLSFSIECVRCARSMGADKRKEFVKWSPRFCRQLTLMSAVFAALIGLTMCLDEGKLF